MLAAKQKHVWELDVVGVKERERNPSTDEFLITLLVPHLVQRVYILKHNFYGAPLSVQNLFLCCGHKSSY